MRKGARIFNARSRSVCGLRWWNAVVLGFYSGYYWSALRPIMGFQLILRSFGRGRCLLSTQGIFNVSATPPAAAPVKAKSKKLIVIGAVLVLLVIVGAGAAWFLASRSQAAEDEEGAEPVRKEAVKVVPTFLPMENMVVNLADPGGDRFAQIGITLEVSDAKTAEQIKQYLPSIRSGILMLTSQRTSEELLQREGKEKLAADILREVSRPLGYSVSSAKPRREVQDDDSEEPAARRKVEKNPVQRVLFSSFIIQ